MVRGSVVMPGGTGKTKRVLVIAKPDKAKEALEAGADFAGSDEYIKKIAEENWFEFDTLVATPDMMVQVGKIGRVLGPRGLMPNPKVGTVTADVKKAVTELKAGRVEFRVEKAGIIQTPFGKASFKPEALAQNLRALLEQLMKLKPQTSKGTYMKSITISTTHGPGIKIDPTPFTDAEPKPKLHLRFRRLTVEEAGITNKPCGDEWTIRTSCSLRSRPSLLIQTRGSLLSVGDTMERAKKEEVLGEITEAWKNVASIVVADYRGITVPVVTAMRDDFRKANCHYRVIKNSLVKIAVKGSKMEPITPAHESAPPP